MLGFPFYTYKIHSRLKNLEYQYQQTANQIESEPNLYQQTSNQIDSIRSVLVGHINSLVENLGYTILPNSCSESITKSLFTRRDSPIIFDIGANVGQSAIKYSHLFPKAQIFSFEPFTESFAELEKIKSDRIKVFNFGFSSHEGTERFFSNRKSVTNSLLATNEKLTEELYGPNDPCKNMIETFCKFQTLDQFCEQHEIEIIDFMKVDTQGTEFKVFEGASRMLKEKKIKVLQVEIIAMHLYHGQKPLSHYIQLFEHYGYKIGAITDISLSENLLGQADFFFFAE